MNPSDSDAYMEMALKAAFLKTGTTSPNPPVGAVIARDGKVLSIGSTCVHGCDHAEVDAIKNTCEPLNNAEMYVSLEPCCHFGKTPPCTEEIIKAGISRVYVPLLDPNPLVKGNGVNHLKNAGVDVVFMHHWAGAAYNIILPFNKYILEKKPFIIYKSAISADGKTATVNGDSKWISSEYSRFLVHRLRSLSDAIIIGKNTFECDNPALDIRLSSFPEAIHEYISHKEFYLDGYNNFSIKMLLRGDPLPERNPPLRVVVGLPEYIDEKSKMLFDDNYLFFADIPDTSVLNSRKDSLLIKRMQTQGKIINIDGDTPNKRIEYILGELYNRGIMIVLLEGGGRLAGSLMDAGEIDQLLFFISPRLIGSGRSVVEGGINSKISDATPLYNITTANIANDILYSAYTKDISEHF